MYLLCRHDFFSKPVSRIIREDHIMVVLISEAHFSIFRISCIVAIYNGYVLQSPFYTSNPLGIGRSGCRQSRQPIGRGTLSPAEATPWYLFNMRHDPSPITVADGSTWLISLFLLPRSDAGCLRADECVIPNMLCARRMNRLGANRFPLFIGLSSVCTSNP